MKIPSKPLQEIWQDIEDFRIKQLARHGIAPLPSFRSPPCCEHLALIIMFVNYGEPVDKDEAAQWIASTAASRGGHCKLDVQSIRKWPRDYGWPIYSGDKKHLDAKGQPLGRSQYCMTGTNPPTAWINKQTRHGSPLSCKSFNELCSFYGWRCVMCGRGGLNRHGEPTLELEQGHMDPRSQLELSNTVPLCEDCNKFQLDSFIVDQAGRVQTILPRESSLRFFRNLTEQERRQLAGLIQAL